MIAKDKQLPFLIALAFLFAFLGIRIAVLLAGSADSEFAQAAEAGMRPDQRFHIGSNIILFGYHIHHFYFGILLICIAGGLAIGGTNRFSMKHLAVMYGAGLGLLLDEAGLLLTWGDYYSSLSYTLSLFVFAVFLNILFFADFWKSFRKQIDQQSLMHKMFLDPNGPLYAIDQLTQKAVPKRKISQAFTAILYIGVAVVVIVLPEHRHYWLAAMLMLQGALYLFTMQPGDHQYEI